MSTLGALFFASNAQPTRQKPLPTQPVRLCFSAPHSQPSAAAPSASS